ncbi:hypothetical protein D3C85_1482170 [compost metagenome]
MLIKDHPIGFFKLRLIKWPVYNCRLSIFIRKAHKGTYCRPEKVFKFILGDNFLNLIAFTNLYFDEAVSCTGGHQHI